MVVAGLLILVGTLVIILHLLRREERSLIEARYRETTKEWPAAFALYRTLATIHPDQIDHSLDLAAAQLRAERPAESLHTVQELRQLPEPLRSDPRIDLAEARAQMERSNFTAALTLLLRAAQKRDQGKVAGTGKTGVPRQG